MITFLIFLGVIAVLVLSHEFGHFIFAKVRGIRVDEFGFGFPPKLFGKKFGETLYTFNLLPFGGFVKIYGEDEADASGDPRSFASRSIKDKFWVIFAGVLMNFLLAYLLFIIIHAVGILSVVDETNEMLARDVGVKIGYVVAASPAERAGLRLGDTIRRLEYDGQYKDIIVVKDVQEFVQAYKGNEIVMEIERSKEPTKVVVVPRVDPPEGEGALGIAMERTGVVRSPWYRAPWDGLKTTLNATQLVTEGLFYFFSNLFRGVVLEEVSGPVGIAMVAGQAGRLGTIYLLQLIALLSVNLAVLNLLPIPALDGGRILFLIIEKIKGSPISASFSQKVHAAGFVFLILLMLLITYRDIIKIF